MREIKASPAFTSDVEALGGYRAIDLALEAIIEALYRDPYGFPHFQNDWTSFRYARTKRVSSVPPLVVVFTIDDNNDVILQHVEEDDQPY